jgi:DNA repair protein SbcD/Mre11
MSGTLLQNHLILFSSLNIFMKIGIFSDTHLGFGAGEQYQETFDRFKEALKILNEKKVDLILHAGDLFDSEVPEQEVWSESIKAFSENMFGETSLTKSSNDSTEKVLVRGTPIIAIHGTHEHRGKDFTNALEVLENAGLLVHIHGEKIIFEKNGEKVAIHGLGGVPEKYAKKVLEKYSPTPVPNMQNFLLLHQSFKEFLPFDDEMVATLSLSDLPNNFDLIINGHLHWPSEQNVNGKRFLLTGSTVFTQMKRLEGENKKGVFIYETKNKDLSFEPFKEQRKLFYHKIKFESVHPDDVKIAVEKQIGKDLSENFFMKPLIRFKLVGTLAKGFSQSDIKIDLPENAIFSISKEFVNEEFKKKIDSFKDEQYKKKGIIELGIDILEKNTEEAGLKDFDTRRIFSLLSEDETEKAEKVLLE